ncbi:peptidoglycan editing factor PgeF [Clostridium sp. Marseille-Q2269]|uniref:peptidoglycan editing factor PgeF n=1 Tax=Clostridium sp. Marseille-Q2269 TaxID=2942205 RepID=UPI002072B527|nr:peptidoglycan editing factor PgeF [Clostridium sp. Marseille-Q2269]
MNFKKINIDEYTFLKLKFKNANFIFSTSEKNLNFNKNIDEGKENLDNIKKWFAVEQVHYLNQIHSNIVRDYKEKDKEGDAVISDKFNNAVGVFTADCTPVLLYDEKNQVIAAVHSGWRGTYERIVIKTIDNMKNNYNTKVENIIAVIGPHIRDCCYEVSYDLINKFKEDKIYNDYNISNKRNLNMELCILAQLDSIGIKRENIMITDLCTMCNDNPKFYSYRKQGNIGRQFSFVYLSKQ